MTRFLRMAGLDYALRHGNEIFGKSIAMNKLSQRPNLGGYVRSDV